MQRGVQRPQASFPDRNSAFSQRYRIHSGGFGLPDAGVSIPGGSPRRGYSDPKATYVRSRPARRLQAMGSRRHRSRSWCRHKVKNPSRSVSFASARCQTSTGCSLGLISAPTSVSFSGSNVMPALRTLAATPLWFERCRCAPSTGPTRWKTGARHRRHSDFRVAMRVWPMPWCLASWHFKPRRPPLSADRPP